MKRQKAIALLLSAAVMMTCFVGCGDGDRERKEDPAGNDTAQEVWWEGKEVADNGLLSYAEYLKLHGETEEVPENIQIEILGGGIFRGGKFRSLCH